MYRSLKIITIALVLLSFFPLEIVFSSFDTMDVRQEVLEEIVVPPVDPSYPSPTKSTIPIIYNLEIINIKTNEATVIWKTQKEALCHLYFGETEEYKRGTISESSFSLDHHLKITNLFQGIEYHIKVICFDKFGARSFPEKKSFQTLLSSLPLNISNFQALPKDGEIELFWNNPLDDNFKGVKIVRSEDFYPVNPYDGKEVYKGSGENFIDKGLENEKRYYYTAFSYNEYGDFSSGVIVSAIPFEDPEFIPPPIDIPLVLPIDPELEKITIDDFYFFQGGKRAYLDKLKEGEPLIVALEYDKVPEVLKTIMVTLIREDEKYFSFLLRINEDKTMYTATIMTPEAGRYGLSIIILDYKNQAIRKIESFIEIIKKRVEIIEKEFSSFFQVLFRYDLFAFLLMFVLLIFFILIRKYGYEEG